MARSPAYPGVGLGEAEALLQRVFKKEQRTPISEAVAVQAMGYSGLNGKTRVLLSALKKYGLLEELPSGDVRVSDLGRDLLHPADEQERQEVRRRAAMQIDLFRDLLKTHAAASDDALRSNLIRRDFTEAGARQAIAAFRDTVKVANLSESRSDPDEERDKDLLVEEDTRTQDDAVRRHEAEQRRRQMESSPTYVWPLPNGREVEIRVTDGGLSKGDLSFLRRYLEVVEDTLTADPPMAAAVAAAPDADDDEIDEGAL